MIVTPEWNLFLTLSNSAKALLVGALIPEAVVDIVDLSERQIAQKLTMARKTIVRAKRELIRAGFIDAERTMEPRHRVPFRLTPLTLKLRPQLEKVSASTRARHGNHFYAPLARPSGARPRLALFVMDVDEIAHYIEGCFVASKRLPRVAENLDWQTQQLYIEDAFLELGKRVLAAGCQPISERNSRYAIRRGLASDGTPPPGEVSPEIRGLTRAGLFEVSCRPQRLRARWRPTAERLWCTVVILL